VLALYRLTIFLSAALLFLVQPMFTRLLLPLLGGAPGVWSAAQVFFQLTLLAGYAYAHLTTTWLGVRLQARAHALVLLAPFLVLPISLWHAAAPPPDASPVPWLVLTMLTTVGLPFFVLSAGGPLLVRWFSTSAHPRAVAPYALHPLGNLGSLVGLFAYPLLIEPRLHLRAQASLWSWLYGALVLLMMACAVFVQRPPEAAETDRVDAAAAPGPRRIFRWIALGFVPSSLMLATTNHLTADVAAVPLLWILPLALYLLSFILAFLPEPLVSPRVLVAAAPAAVVLGLVDAAAPVLQLVGLRLVMGLAVFFVLATVCHSELARDRPPARHATGFFLWIALGGVLGSAFCALLAPLLFDTVIEHAVSLVAAAFVLPALAAPAPAAVAESPAPAEPPARPLRVELGLSLAVGVACGLGMLFNRAGRLADPLALAIGLGALAHLVHVAAPRPLFLGLSLAASLAVVHRIELRADGALLRDRSFFGALAVTQQGSQRLLSHGATLHGIQAVTPGPSSAPAAPLAYYGASGPIGQLFLRGPVPADARVAVVGLGVGSLIAYAQPTQRWTFYELDPAVARVAQDPRYFTFLAEARAPYDLVLGDARRSLAASHEQFSLIVLDAYSSDAVPVHLLTREAVALYLRRLTEGGVIALHISHRHLDLLAVVSGIAGSLGIPCLHQNAGVSRAEAASGLRSSHWAILARRPEDFGVLAGDPRWSPPPAGGQVVWTDDASSLLPIWSGG
jgi:hypothetical protein